MDFINKLFPYKSLYLFNSDSITAYWVVITFGVFFIYLIKLFWTTHRLNKELKDSIDNFNESFEKKIFLKIAWASYYKSFFIINGSTKTHDDANSHFNDASLLYNPQNFRIIHSVPSILVGIGILGTFVGLTFGISDFKTSSTQMIQSSIEKLLTGMGTAFVSSIWGMLLSLVFTYIEKIKFNIVHSNLLDFCNLLNSRYLFTKNDEYLLQLTNTKAAISEYFAFNDENNNSIKPSNVLRDLFIESEKQSRALQSFSTELANKIEAGFENILSNQFQNNIIPVLAEIKSEIQQLSNNVKDPAGQMAQVVVDDLKNVMSSMIADFKNSITSSTSLEMENLNSKMAATAEAISSIPDMLKITSNEMNSIIEKLGSQLQNKFQMINVEQELLINTQKENLQLSGKHLGSFDESINKINDSMLNVRQIISDFSILLNDLSSASTNINSATNNILGVSNQLGGFQNKLMQFATDTINKNDITIQKIEDMIQYTNNVSNEYVSKFSIIEKGLVEIFLNIQKGITEYSTTIEKNLREHLNIYTDSMTKSSQAFSTSIDKLDESVNSLSEEIEKLNNTSR